MIAGLSRLNDFSGSAIAAKFHNNFQDVLQCDIGTMVANSGNFMPLGDESIT